MQQPRAVCVARRSLNCAHPPKPDEFDVVRRRRDNATQIVLTFDDNRLASVLFGQYGQNLA